MNLNETFISYLNNNYKSEIITIKIEKLKNYKDEPTHLYD